MARDVLPHVLGVCVDEPKTKVIFEISFSRYLYNCRPPRPLEEIKTGLRQIRREIANMLAEVTE